MKSRISSYLSGPAAVVILLAFFLPWVTLSCNAGLGMEQKIVTGNGMDLATGIKAKDTLLGDEEFDFESTDYVAEDGMSVSSDISIDTPGPDENVIDPAPYLWLIPLLALGVGAVTLAYTMQIFSKDVAGNLYGLMGVAGFALHLIKFAQLRADLSTNNADDMFILHYEIGWWLSLFGFGLVLAASVLAWYERAESPQPIYPTSAPQPYQQP
jgi:hypothetical protein